MGLNRNRPHLIVWFEDDAYRQIANGFLLNPAVDQRALHVSKALFGGWGKVADELDNIDEYQMSRFAERRILLLIDYDGKPDRFDQIKKKIPPNLGERVFVLGILSEAEELRSNHQDEL